MAISFSSGGASLDSSLLSSRSVTTSLVGGGFGFFKSLLPDLALFMSSASMRLILRTWKSIKKNEHKDDGHEEKVIRSNCHCGFLEFRSNFAPPSPRTILTKTRGLR